MARKLFLPVLLGLSSLLALAVAAEAPPAGVLEHLEMCDASAAVAVGSTLFVAASDEDNVLRVYRRDQGGDPVHRHDVSKFLDLGKKDEADLEAATWLGDRIFWITSHGADKNGNPRKERRRLFATRVDVSEGQVQVTPDGKPYKNLLEDLVDHPQLKPHRLDLAANKPPKSEGALNIEGLAATPTGSLLIGFRNPIPKKKALLVPLENPQEVLDGNRPKLGRLIELDLNGLGIRSIEYWKERGRFLVIAGAFNADDNFALYEWSGRAEDPPVRLKKVDLQGLNPEALVLYPDPGLRNVQILSDDGTREVNGTECKDLDRGKRRFRSVWVSP